MESQRDSFRQRVSDFFHRLLSESQTREQALQQARDQGDADTRARWAAQQLDQVERYLRQHQGGRDGR